MHDLRFTVLSGPKVAHCHGRVTTAVIHQQSAIAVPYNLSRMLIFQLLLHTRWLIGCGCASPEGVTVSQAV